MKNIAGGLWLWALIAKALLGFIPALILFIIGAILAAYELARELQAERQAASWRKNYPSYKY